MNARARILTAVLAAALLVSAGNCSKKEPPPTGKAEGNQPAAPPSPGAPTAQGKEPRWYNQPMGQNPILAPVDYMTAAIAARRRAMEQAALAQLVTDIKTFRLMQERYPASLEELAKWRGAPLPTLPEGLGYKYDPKSGALEVVDVPLKRSPPGLKQEAMWPSRPRLGTHSRGRLCYARIMTSSILNRFTAFSACGTAAGMRTIWPACARTGFPPILSSASPSSTTT